MTSSKPPRTAETPGAPDGGDTRPDGTDTQELTAPVTVGLARRDPSLAPGLYVVSTPIGNLRDITLRALDVLSSVDFVCAEDTRVTAKLLAAHGVSARLRPYHDHNAAQARPALIAELQAGARIALASDAGTPLVSDPGFKLVREAVALGLPVHAIPGASAPLAALAAAGLPTDRFLFAGFPPPRSAARKTFLRELAAVDATLVFFEGPSRLAASLADMAEVLGARDGVVARELTKKFEEFRRGSLQELASFYTGDGPPRGELVVLVGPPQGGREVGADTLDAAILEAGEETSLKDLSAALSERFGLKRKLVYSRALELLRPDGDGDDETGEAPA